MGKSSEYMAEVLASRRHSGDGKYARMCAEWIEGVVCRGSVQAGTMQGHVASEASALMTTSGSHALDMAAWLCGIEPGDEVIMPSYTFSSTANAFVGRGATIVFVDVRPDTMNMDEGLIEAAITPKTKAIVPVHYAGVPCDMDEINRIARAHGLKVVEDAAQAVLSTYKGMPCGGLSDFGCFSFHETKNFSMGEGGALVVRRKEDRERAEIIREKGTNRSKFFRGEVDKYTWVEWGSSYLPSEFLCAHLWGQFEMAGEIVRDRLASWHLYYDGLRGLGLDGEGVIDLPYIPENCKHNGHLFYVKAKDACERDALLAWLKQEGIGAVFHYVPLHSAPAGQKYGRFCGEDRYTTKESERLLRLPMFYGLKEDEIAYIVGKVKEFYAGDKE